MFIGTNIKVLQIVIQMPPATVDGPRARAEAQEVATLYDVVARSWEIDRIAVRVCDTAECIEWSADPVTTFFFRRSEDGSWIVDV
jgi:hypothetical protein